MAVLPNWIYEPLPYLYTGAGFIALLNLDTLVGKISGILLISAGVVVGYQRYEYRSFHKQRLERQNWLQEQARKKKTDRQAWLREQAKQLRTEMDRKNDDF